MQNINEKALAVTAEVSKAVLGKPEVVLKIMMAILARGHVLIEDIPGVGKTTLAQAFARAMDLTQNRVQFTPDVLPSDIVGFSLYQKETGKFVYHPGAVMCNLFLADEINRTSARTQSALLEVMEESAVTVDGVTRVLPQPFTVFQRQTPSARWVRRCCRNPSWTVLWSAWSWATPMRRRKWRFCPASRAVPCWTVCSR